MGTGTQPTICEGLPSTKPGSSRPHRTIASTVIASPIRSSAIPPRPLSATTSSPTQSPGPSTEPSPLPLTGSINVEIAVCWTVRPSRTSTTARVGTRRSVPAGRSLKRTFDPSGEMATTVAPGASVRTCPGPSIASTSVVSSPIPSRYAMRTSPAHPITMRRSSLTHCVPSPASDTEGDTQIPNSGACEITSPVAQFDVARAPSWRTANDTARMERCCPVSRSDATTLPPPMFVQLEYRRVWSSTKVATGLNSPAICPSGDEARATGGRPSPTRFRPTMNGTGDSARYPIVSGPLVDGAEVVPPLVGAAGEGPAQGEPPHTSSTRVRLESPAFATQTASAVTATPTGSRPVDTPSASTLPDLLSSSVSCPVPLEAVPGDAAHPESGPRAMGPAPGTGVRKGMSAPVILSTQSPPDVQTSLPSLTMPPAALQLAGPGAMRSRSMGNGSRKPSAVYTAARPALGPRSTITLSPTTTRAEGVNGRSTVCVTRSVAGSMPTSCPPPSGSCTVTQTEPAPTATPEAGPPTSIR